MSSADHGRSPEPSGQEEPDYRFTLANERTFLAWIRTALALIAGGIAVVQFVPAFGIPGVRHGLSVALPPAVAYWRRWQFGAGNAYKPRCVEGQICQPRTFRCCSAG